MNFTHPFYPILLPNTHMCVFFTSQVSQKPTIFSMISKYYLTFTPLSCIGDRVLPLPADLKSPGKHPPHPPQHVSDSVNHRYKTYIDGVNPNWD